MIAGKYELVRPLGQGSMGEVWLARHRTLGEEVAIKLLKRPPWSGDYFEDHSTSAARFRLEAQVAARLSRKTKHIVRVTDHGEERGLAYLVMEYLEGTTLEARLSEGPPFAAGEVVEIVTQLGRALECAHGEGVVHRDLKPANVFLTADEEGQLLVKVFDFGIACLTHQHRPASMGAEPEAGPRILLGTPGYMSPEQARGQSPLDPQCDLWALATIAYEALTGQLPVEGTEADELLKNLGAARIVPFRARRGDEAGAFDALFTRALAESAGDRFSNAAEMVRALRSAASVVPAGLCPKGSVEACCDEPLGTRVGVVAPASSSSARLVRTTSPSRVRSPRRRAAVAGLIALSAVAAACGLAERPPYVLHAPGAWAAPSVVAVTTGGAAPVPVWNPPVPPSPPSAPTADAPTADAPMAPTAATIARERQSAPTPIPQGPRTMPASAARRSLDKSAVL
ncbi:MAG TPA: protein kinase [Polyangiaceae bacterium]|nr:protein kinase [Polyangiaceae bacterium]